MHAPTRSPSPQSKRQALSRMHAALRRWIEWNLDYPRRQMMFLEPKPQAELQEMERAQRDLTAQWARRARRYLSYLTQDNSDLDADQLAEIADALSPGGVDNGADLYWNLLDAGVDIDPLIRAALIYRNWHGGKVGFQFLPDPARTDPEDYEFEADNLVQSLFEATDGKVGGILTGKDRDFYESLPARFTIYRGCSGISPELAGLGVCWTTDRRIAEWFAHRGSREPVLVTGSIRKVEIVLANASEKEVVCIPRHSRSLKCRKPVKMAWQSGW
ncbi:hypothetical protein [Mesorhizobium sp.]|uniref:hypothetical protein n=1 Tax=Mesorhizobium sp. TaxID=1871066 RepID=UPI000FE7B0CC|nr:hypothetical protein [Mesorhizobium sp.]RWO55383.1 MAG: hypothetical protein EOS14_30060 [Mesorhizobium sp.]